MTHINDGDINYINNYKTFYLTHTITHTHTHTLRTVENWFAAKHLIIKTCNFCKASISISKMLMRWKIKRYNSTWVLQCFLSPLVLWCFLSPFFAGWCLLWCWYKHLSLCMWEGINSYWFLSSTDTHWEDEQRLIFSFSFYKCLSFKLSELIKKISIKLL